MQPPVDTEDSPGRPVHLSVVIPCYNEEQCLNELWRRVRESCLPVTESFELVLVDDGSRDRTWPMMVELHRADPRVVGLRLSRNHGHQLALTAGLSVCRGQRILVLDADLQDPPELLPQMMALMDDGADVVYGQRIDRAGESWFKKQTAKGFYRLVNWMSDAPIPADTGDFRLMSRRVLKVFNAMPEAHRYIRGMISWVGFRQEPLLYRREGRYAGQTKYPLRKMLRLAADAIISFSTMPLRLAALLAGVFALFGVALLVYVILSWMRGQAVTGWASLLAALSIMSSAQLTVMAVMGAYLGRLYEQSKGRPLFIVEQLQQEELRA